MINVNESHRAVLKQIRGRYTGSKSDRFQENFYTYLFTYAVPLFFLYVFLSDGAPSYPYTNDQWTVLVMIPVSFCLGLFFKHKLGWIYVFDGTYIEELSPKGQLRKKIAINDIISLTQSSNRGVHFIELKTEREWINIVLPKSLMDDIRQIEAQQVGAHNGEQPEAARRM